MAPQWQEFNGGNWVDIENAVRYYVEDFSVDFTVYTGTNGVMQLDDVNANKVDIYLYPESMSGDVDRLPVPKSVTFRVC